MRLNPNQMPPNPLKWGDLVEAGTVVSPHPTAGKQQLWEWINEHSVILESLLDSLKRNVSGEDNPYLVSELRRQAQASPKQS